MDPTVTGAGRIETPERIGLDLDLAGVGSRGLACLLDTALMAAIFLFLLMTVALLGDLLGSSAPLVLIVASFLLQWFYFAVFEAVFNGRTPGKLLMNLRVQRVGGYPIGWTEALIRNFLRLADFLFFYAVGLTIMLLNDRSQRLGDLAAGTVVVRERAGGLAQLRSLGYTGSAVPSVQAGSGDPAGAGAAAPSGGSPLLTAREFETLHDFLQRRASLEAGAAERIEARLAAALRARLESRGTLRESWRAEPDGGFLESIRRAYLQAGA